MDFTKHVQSIKAIKAYDADLEKQNLWWTVVAMVGKINNQGLAPQLLDSISVTQKQFDKLKQTLIESLVKRYLEKVEVDLKLQSKAFIDILNRNLFERTADVGFLAEDTVLMNYVADKQAHSNAQVRTKVEAHLQEYVNKYTVYMDVVLFDESGKVVASLFQPHSNECSSSSIIFEALKAPGYIEYDEPIDLVEYSQSPLYFLQAIKSQGQAVGVLCMSFKFMDEMNRIFTTLNNEESNFQLVLSSRKQNLFSSHPSPHCYSDIKVLNHFLEKKMDSKTVFCYSSKTQGYQGYCGLDWQSFACIPIPEAFKVGEHSGDYKLDAQSSLFPEDLHMLNLEINTALTVVILNGKISSIKNKVDSFLPVLDYFQDIGLQVREVFADSIDHIHHIAHQTMQEKVLFAAKVALDVMDRNLYERANDCRWWALNPVFIKAVQNPQAEEEALSDTLAKINELYTVYTVLFVFEEFGRVISVSKSNYHYLIGRDVEEVLSISNIKALNSSQGYEVSKFAKTAFYDNQETYIYSAAIRNEMSNQVIGGVGVVFDAKPEFKTILMDFLPKESNGKVIEGAFALFMDGAQQIISVTENDFGIEVGQHLNNLPAGFAKLNQISELGDLTLNKKNYLVARQSSQGYREYKNGDGYQNTMSCYVLVES